MSFCLKRRLPSGAKLSDTLFPYTRPFRSAGTIFGEGESPDVARRMAHGFSSAPTSGNRGARPSTSGRSPGVPRAFDIRAVTVIVDDSDTGHHGVAGFNVPFSSIP